MPSREEKALQQARARAEQAGWKDVELAVRLQSEVVAAEVALAQSRDEPWAEIIDLGDWRGGAPLPHLVSGGRDAILVCHENVRVSGWDGTTVRVVAPDDHDPEPLIVLTFRRCTSIRFGFPNDDVLHGLRIPGVRPARAHRVHNSAWIAELDRIESVHPTPHRFEGTHYLLSFHDDLFEAIAHDVEVERVTSTLSDALADAARRITR